MTFKVPIALLTKLRLLVGWAPFDRLAIYAGPTFNVMQDRISTPDSTNRPGYRWAFDVRDRSRGRVRMWPGFVAGLRF